MCASVPRHGRPNPVTAPACPCGETAPPSSKGQATASWLDRVDGVTVRVTRDLRRFSCRCGRSVTPGLPDLEEGHRMTPEVAEAILDDALDNTFAEVAGTHLTNRTTVAEIYAKRVADMLARHAPNPDTLALWSMGKDGTLVLACDASPAPEVVDAFTGFDDPRLGRMVLGRAARIHADWETGCAVLARWPAARVTIAREACLAYVWGRMPSCVGRLRTGLDKAARRVLAGVRRALETPPYEVGIAEAEGLREAASAVPAIRRFAAARDRLVSCLGRADVRAARAAFADACTDGDVSRWFRPVATALSGMRDAVFNAGYGCLSPATWRAVGALTVHVVPGEPTARTVARHLRRTMVGESPRHGMDPWGSPAPARDR